MSLLSLPPELLRAIIEIVGHLDDASETRYSGSDAARHGSISWPNRDTGSLRALRSTSCKMSMYALEALSQHIYHPTSGCLDRMLSLDLGGNVRSLRVYLDPSSDTKVSKLLGQTTSLERFGLTILQPERIQEYPHALEGVQCALPSLTSLQNLDLDLSYVSQTFEADAGLRLIQQLSSPSLHTLRIMHMHELKTNMLDFANLPKLHSLTIDGILHEPIEVLAGLARASSLRHLQVCGLPEGDYLLSALVPDGCRSRLESLVIETAHDYGLLFTIGDMRDHGSLQNLEFGTTLLSAINCNELPASLVRLACRVELSTLLYDFVDLRRLPNLRYVSLCGSELAKGPELQQMLLGQEVEINWADLVDDWDDSL